MLSFERVRLYSCRMLQLLYRLPRAAVRKRTTPPDLQNKGLPTFERQNFSDTNPKDGASYVYIAFLTTNTGRTFCPVRCYLLPARPAGSTDFIRSRRCAR